MMAEQYLKHPLAGKKFTGAEARKGEVKAQQAPAGAKTSAGKNAAAGTGTGAGAGTDAGTGLNNAAGTKASAGAGTGAGPDNVVETIKKVLSESGVYGWQITDTSVRGWEFYFIRHRLDQNRVRNVRHIEAKVYVRSEENTENGTSVTVGDASAEIPPTASEAEIRREAERLKAQAGLIRNPAYTLNPAVTKEEAAKLAEDMAAAGAGKAGTGARTDAAFVSGDFIRLMKGIRETPTEDINSYEIFVNSVTRRILTSEGTDVTESFPQSSLEVVTNARKDGREIEMYRMFHSGTCGTENLKAEIEDQLVRGKDRLLTKPTPDLKKSAVVFSSHEMLAIYNWFLTNLSAQAVVQGISQWKPGEAVADRFDGDRVTVDAVPYLPNSPKNFLLDEEGAPVTDLRLMTDGVCEHYWGSRQYACRLGLERSFIPTNTVFSGGTRSAEEIRQGNFLEVVEFSDFQVNGMTGNIAGEIRLAYWHENGKVTPVSGGSVSGSMKEFIRSMTMTRESRQYGNTLVPAAVRLEGVTVSGIAEV